MTEKSSSVFEINKNQTQNLGTKSEITEKILLVITEHTESENKDFYSRDRIFDIIQDIADSIQQEFEKLIGIDSNKKMFVRNLSKLFAILLNTDYDTAKKIKRVIKIAIETTLKLWPEPRQQ